MSRLCALNYLLLGTLFTVLAARDVRAESATDPLHEMRAAAEAVADIDPDSPRRPLREVPAAPLGTVKASDRSVLLRDAIRAEIERETLPPVQGVIPASQKPGTAGGHSTGGPVSEEVRGAAARAQEARRNREIATERGQSTTAPGRLKQESTHPEKAAPRSTGR